MFHIFVIILFKYIHSIYPSRIQYIRVITNIIYNSCESKKNFINFTKLNIA